MRPGAVPRPQGIAGVNARKTTPDPRQYRLILDLIGMEYYFKSMK